MPLLQVLGGSVDADLWWNVEFLVCVISRDSVKAWSLSGLLTGCGLAFQQLRLYLGNHITSTPVDSFEDRRDASHMKAKHLCSGKAMCAQQGCLKAHGLSHRGWLTSDFHELCCFILFKLCSLHGGSMLLWASTDLIYLSVSKMRWFLLMLFCLISSPGAVSTWNNNKRWIIMNTFNWHFLLKFSSSESDSQCSDSSSSSDSNEVRIQSCLSYINSLPKTDFLSFFPLLARAGIHHPLPHLPRPRRQPQLRR